MVCVRVCVCVGRPVLGGGRGGGWTGRVGYESYKSQCVRRQRVVVHASGKGIDPHHGGYNHLSWDGVMVLLVFTRADPNAPVPPRGEIPHCKWPRCFAGVARARGSPRRRNNNARASAKRLTSSSKKKVLCC